MKKILSLIFMVAVIAFTGCAEESNTPESRSANETATAEGTAEDMTENETDINMSDKEYLINLGKQLELGMPYEEMINKIGKPDEYIGSGCLDLQVYYKGEYSLWVEIENTNTNPDDEDVYVVGDVYLCRGDSDEKMTVFSSADVNETEESTADTKISDE